MALSLNSATAERIQRRAEPGPFHEPDEVVNRALDLLESQESWTALNRDAIPHAIEARLEHSWAHAERGELYTPEEALRILDERRAARAANAEPRQTI